MRLFFRNLKLIFLPLVLSFGFIIGLTPTTVLANVQLQVMPVFLMVTSYTIINGMIGQFIPMTANMSASLDKDTGGNILHIISHVPQPINANQYGAQLPNALRLVTKGAELANGAFSISYSATPQGGNTISDNVVINVQNGQFSIQNVKKTVGKTTCGIDTITQGPTNYLGLTCQVDTTSN